MSAHVTVTFDQPRRLFFSMKAMKSLTRTLGDVGLVTVLQRLKDMHLPTLERVLLAGLLHEEPALTLDVVSARIEKMYDDEGPVGQLFVDAINALSETHMFKMTEDVEGNRQREPA